MKNLSDKFDNLPQDFDPEVIWQGIEKPVRRPNRRRHFIWVVVLLLIATTALIRFVSRQPKPAEQKSGTIADNKKATIKAADVYAGANIPVEQQEVRVGGFASASPNTNIAHKSGEITNSPEKNTSSEYLTREKTSPETFDLFDTIPQYSPENPAADPNSIIVNKLPARTFAVDFSKQKPVLYSIPNIIVIHKKRKQSVALSIDIGKHTSHFEAPSDENEALRSQLELPQLDYGLGLRYEYLLKKSFFLSASANYHLYKDKINTAYIRQYPGQDLLVDYRLYNHYHVFAGQIELGKRFARRYFYWDVQGGFGLKIHQISEVDYFVSEQTLAEAEQISITYRNTPDMFFTAQAALGKQLGHRTFVRLGVQATPGLTLSASGSDLTHQINPFRAFIEAGIRF